MNTLKTTNILLNNLIAINNQRVTVYEKAAIASKIYDPELLGIFQSFANDSNKNARLLLQEIVNIGGEFSTLTSNNQLNQQWANVNFLIEDTDRQAMLQACKGCEETTQQCYQMAMDQLAGMTTQTKNLVFEQQAALKIAGSLIKFYCNAQVTA